MQIKIRFRPGFFLLVAMSFLLLPLKWFVSAVVAALIHELGHISAIVLTNGCIKCIELYSLGARIHTLPMSNAKETACAYAGPILGGLLLLVYPYFPELSICATMQTLFNLLPVMPLDGGRGVRSILLGICRNNKVVSRVMAGISFICFAVVYILILNPILGTLGLVIPVILILRCLGEEILDKILHSDKLKKIMQRRILYDSGDYSLKKYFPRVGK